MSDAACQPDVTVLVAALNASAYMARAIDSALSQEGVTLEVLVIDDGSTDDTAQAATSSGDPRVRVIRTQDNRGPSAARNLGVEEARGEWVAVLDADDAYEPGRLARLLHLGRTGNADLVADNFRFYTAERDEVSDPALSAGAVETLTPTSFVERARPYRDEPDFGLLKPAFRRAFLLNNDLRYPEDVRHGEDFLLVFNALLAGGSYLLTRETGYVYTTRDSGRSRTRVDYEGLVLMARRLARLPAVRSHPGLIDALSRRAGALARLAAERRVAAAWAARDVRALALAAGRGPQEVKAVLRRVIRSVSR